VSVLNFEYSILFIFGRSRCVISFPTKEQKNLKKLRKKSKNGRLFLKKIKNFSKKRLRIS